MKIKTYILDILVILFLVIGTSYLLYTYFNKEAIVKSNNIKIGVLVPLNGKYKEAGRNILTNVQKTVNKINIEGGIDGKRLEIVSEDTHCTKTLAEEGVNLLIQKHGIKYLLGGVCKSSIQGIYETSYYKKLNTFVFNSLDEVPDKYRKYMFNVVGKETSAVMNIIEFLLKNDVKDIGILEEGITIDEETIKFNKLHILE